MDRNRLDPVALRALRSLAPSDPLAPLVARAMRARVPHQRDLNLVPRSEAYLDALSEADPRDLSYRDAMNLRNAPALEEPSATGVAPTGVRMVKEYGADWRGSPRQYEVANGYGGSDIPPEYATDMDLDDAMRNRSGAAMTAAEFERLRAMRGGR